MKISLCLIVLFDFRLSKIDSMTLYSKKITLKYFFLCPIDLSGVWPLNSKKFEPLNEEALFSHPTVELRIDATAATSNAA